MSGVILKPNFSSYSWKSSPEKILFTKFANNFYGSYKQPNAISDDYHDIIIAGNFHKVQNFAVFMDRLAVVKLRTMKFRYSALCVSYCACYNANKLMVGVVSSECWHKFRTMEISSA